MALRYNKPTGRVPGKYINYESNNYNRKPNGNGYLQHGFKRKTTNPKSKNCGRSRKDDKKELAVGRKPHTVTIRIMENNRIINKWIYKPTIR